MVVHIVIGKGMYRFYLTKCFFSVKAPARARSTVLALLFVCEISLLFSFTLLASQRRISNREISLLIFMMRQTQTSGQQNILPRLYILCLALAVTTESAFTEFY